MGLVALEVVGDHVGDGTGELPGRWHVQELIRAVRVGPRAQDAGNDTADQQRWLDAFRALTPTPAAAGGPDTPIEVYIWRPSGLGASLTSWHSRWPV